jgi:ribonuclease HI
LYNQLASSRSAGPELIIPVKSFGTLAEANAYIAGSEPLEASISSNAPDKRFYGVARGRIPGVYTEWAAAEEQIKGWRGGPKYKKFTTCAEAEAFVQQYGMASAQTEETPGASASEAEIKGRMTACDVEDEIASVNTIKRARQANPEDEIDSDLLDVKADVAELNQDAGVSSASEIATRSGVLRIWTDGSSRGNGKVGATAGLGVHFGDADSR